MLYGVSNCEIFPSLKKAILSHIVKASFGLWVISIAVVFSFFNVFLISVISVSFNSSSRALKGSSSNKIDGFGAIARAMATLCCWPPEIWCGYLSAIDEIFNISSSFVDLIFWFFSFSLWRPKQIFSLTVRCGNKAKSWKITPIFLLSTLTKFLLSSTVISSILIVPEEILLNPAIDRIRDVFPDALEPIKEIISPSFTFRSTPDSTTWPSNIILTSSSCNLFLVIFY